MAGNGKELGQQLKELISSLQDQGILNNYFDELKGLQDEKDPCFVHECITIFLREAEDYRAELTTNLSERDVNYRKVHDVAVKLKANSASLGCGRMVLACQELRDASEAKNKQGCLVGLDNVNREYLVTRENLNRIAEMERVIYENEAGTKAT